MQEVELGLAADVGTLQRLPKIVGNERSTSVVVFSIGFNSVFDSKF
jgi:enoyl-CoA hydratase/carnithine racemase